MEKENKKTEVFKGMPKDKVVFASFVCEHIFRDENNFDSYVEFLGIFTDPEKAEKACNEGNKKGWIPITSNITPENKIFYKIKGDYYFNNDWLLFNVCCFGCIFNYGTFIKIIYKYVFFVKIFISYLIPVFFF